MVSAPNSTTLITTLKIVRIALLIEPPGSAHCDPVISPLQVTKGNIAIGIGAGECLRVNAATLMAATTAAARWCVPWPFYIIFVADLPISLFAFALLWDENRAIYALIAGSILGTSG